MKTLCLSLLRDLNWCCAVEYYLDIISHIAEVKILGSSNVKIYRLVVNKYKMRHINTIAEMGDKTIL